MQGEEETAREEWRVVREAPRYMVSSQGNVKDTVKNKMVKNYMGYVPMTVNNKHTTKSLARLILENFTPKETHKPWIDFINGNKKDIRLDNMRWHQTRTHEEALEYQRQYQKKMKGQDNTSPRKPFKNPTEFYQDWNEQLSHQLEKDLPQWIKKAISKLIDMNNETINKSR